MKTKKNKSAGIENIHEIMQTSLLPVLRTITHSLMRVIEKSGMSTSKAIVMLNLLVKPSKSEPAQLADLSIIPRQTMTSVLDSLERDGFIKRKAHPNDRRRKLIVLTASGLKRACGILSGLVDFEREVYAGMDGEELSVIRCLSVKLKDRIEEVAALREEEKAQK